MGGGVGGHGIGWVGHGHGVVGAHVARHRAIRSGLNSTESMLEADGIPLPSRPNWLILLWRHFKEWRKQRSEQQTAEGQPK